MTSNSCHNPNCDISDKTPEDYSDPRWKDYSDSGHVVYGISFTTSIPENTTAFIYLDKMAEYSNSSGDADQDHVDPVFESELDRKYICPICLSYLKEPVQTPCGHRFCRLCVSQLGSTVRGGSCIKCPVDNTRILNIDQLFTDNAANREVKSLRVLCNNQQDGCSWRGELGDLKRHLRVCLFSMKHCPFQCGLRLQEKKISDHLKKCGMRRVECEHCFEEHRFMDLTKHQVLNCQMIAVPCTLCGQTGILRKDIVHHIDPVLGDCQHAKIPCQYAAYGCDFETKRLNMPKHYIEADVHLQLLVKHVNQLDARFTAMERRLELTQLSLMSLQGGLRWNSTNAENPGSLSHHNPQV